MELGEGKLKAKLAEDEEEEFRPGEGHIFRSSLRELVFVTDEKGAVIRVEVQVQGKSIVTLPRIN